MILLALVVSAGAVWQYRELVRTKDDLGVELIESGLAESRPDVGESLRREPDPLSSRMLVARAFLAEVLAPPRDGLSAEEIQRRRLDLLARARHLAESILETLPSSWAGLFVLGATIYLERSLLQDDRLLTQYRDWEAPLEQARRIAPHEPDPQRFLTMAYLEIWPMLSESKRDLTRSMLETAFSDRRVFELFIEPWLLVAGDGPDALEPLPTEPYVWEGVARIFLRDRKWSLAAESHSRWVEALDQHLHDQITEGEARLAGGDVRHAQDRFLYAMSMTPLDVRSVPLMTTTLDRLPPGPVAPATAEIASRWLRWHLERCLYQSCLFPENAQRRLQQMAGELDPATAARSHLATSDLFGAQQIERASAADSHEWSRYWLQKAVLLLARGAVDEALESLGRVRGELRASALFRWRSALAADARREGGSGVIGGQAEASATNSLWGSVKEVWLESEWQGAPGRTQRLVLWPVSGPPGLQLEFALGAEGVVEIVWDGAALGSFAVEPETPEIEIAVDVTSQVHLLELRVLGGRIRAPTTVRLGNI